MQKSNNHTQGKIRAFEKDPIPTPMSCPVDTSTLGEIEGSGYHSF